MLIVKNISSNFNNSFQLYGTDWKNYFIEAGNNIEKKRIIQTCIVVTFVWILVLFQVPSLYPRSIEIIESGGYLLQLKQSDLAKFW